MGLKYVLLNGKESLSRMRDLKLKWTPSIRKLEHKLLDKVMFRRCRNLAPFAQSTEDMRPWILENTQDAVTILSAISKMIQGAKPVRLIYMDDSDASNCHIIQINPSNNVCIISR